VIHRYPPRAYAEVVQVPWDSVAGYVLEGMAPPVTLLGIAEAEARNWEVIGWTQFTASQIEDEQPLYKLGPERGADIVAFARRYEGERMVMKPVEVPTTTVTRAQLKEGKKRSEYKEVTTTTTTEYIPEHRPVYRHAAYYLRRIQ
jgi:hypothetical protein